MIDLSKVLDQYNGALADPTEPWHESRIRELYQERDELNRRLRANDELLVKSLDERDAVRKAMGTYSAAIERLRKAIDTGTAWTADQVVDQAIAIIGNVWEADAKVDLPIDADALARIYYEQRLRALGFRDPNFDAAGNEQQGAERAGARAVAQALASALLSEQAVEAATIEFHRTSTRKAIEAALRVAVTLPEAEAEAKRPEAEEWQPLSNCAVNWMLDCKAGRSLGVNAVGEADDNVDAARLSDVRRMAMVLAEVVERLSKRPQ